jgi:hypothetical protein
MSHSLAPRRTSLHSTVNRLSAPGSMELSSLFRNFIRYWAGMKANYHGEIHDEPAPMPVEICVRWNGPVRGTLVLRCFADFSKRVQKNFDSSWTPMVEKELLGELATLFCVHLINSYWSRDFFEMGPVLARPSHPGDWPPRTADATCNLSVDQQWVELRLWVDSAQEQKNLIGDQT